MSRRRLTQIFPFLLPLRKWQRKKIFYLSMWLDKNKYAKEKSPELLPYTVYSASSCMLNENSGFDMEYQYNKVFNLKLAAKTLDRILIRPGETFSFWQLVGKADKKELYKDGLILINGEIVPSYGGGLCQISNLLFWVFLHTPLKIVERHGHAVESFPSPDKEAVCGTDATINEGWLDLKVKNETAETFQISVSFDEKMIWGTILSDREPDKTYEVFNQSVSYFRKNGKVYQTAVVCRMTENKTDHSWVNEELYENLCQIGYDLPAQICVKEERSD